MSLPVVKEHLNIYDKRNIYDWNVVNEIHVVTTHMAPPGE